MVKQQFPFYYDHFRYEHCHITVLARILRTGEKKNEKKGKKKEILLSHYLMAGSSFSLTPCQRTFLLCELLLC